MTCTHTDNGWTLRTHLRDCTDRHCRGCEPCTHDEHGNPTRHCRIRYRCHSHLDWGEHACPTCLGKIRRNLRDILDAMALMPTEAGESGVDSEAANLAGPVGNPVLTSWRLIRLDAAGLKVEELDYREPYTALTLRERMIREDLGQDLDTLVSPDLATVCGYLDRALSDLARDERQVPVIADLLQTSARLRDHLETVLHNSRTPERGAPCPLCVQAGTGVRRLTRRYGHWCTRPDCTREHVYSDARDTWVCPADPEHWWTHAAYTNWVEERQMQGLGERA